MTRVSKDPHHRHSRGPSSPDADAIFKPTEDEAFIVVVWRMFLLAFSLLSLQKSLPQISRVQKHKTFGLSEQQQQQQAMARMKMKACRGRNRRLSCVRQLLDCQQPLAYNTVFIFLVFFAPQSHEKSAASSKSST